MSPAASIALHYRLLAQQLSPSPVFPAMAAEPDSAVRHRKAVADTAATSVQDAQASSDNGGGKRSSRKGKRVDADEVEYGNPWVDVLRVLSFLLFVSCGASYLVSGGESFFWSMKVPPKYLRLETWKGLIVRAPPSSRSRCSLPRDLLTDRSSYASRTGPAT